MGGGQQSIVAYPLEARRQDMLEETAEESGSPVSLRTRRRGCAKDKIDAIFPLIHSRKETSASFLCLELCNLSVNPKIRDRNFEQPTPSLFRAFFCANGVRSTRRLRLSAALAPISRVKRPAARNSDIPRPRGSPQMRVWRAAPGNRVTFPLRSPVPNIASECARTAR
jgi:hypothetical protein